MKSVVLVALASALVASDIWSHKPLVSYDDEHVRCVWTGSPAVWNIAVGEGRVLPDPAGLAVDWVPRSGSRLVLSDNRQSESGTPTGNGPGLRAVAPGEPTMLTLKDGVLQAGDDAAILVLSRIEARSDRRWSLVRALGDDRPKPCAQALLCPEGIRSGHSPLIAQCVMASGTRWSGAGVLIEVSPAERDVAWKHREFRQVLAWLVADVQARGAGFVTLVQPRAAASIDASLEPLRIQVTDVANAYRCRVVDPLALGDEACWRLAEGILGWDLNAHGQTVRAELLATWMQ